MNKKAILKTILIFFIESLIVFSIISLILILPIMVRLVTGANRGQKKRNNIVKEIMSCEAVKSIDDIYSYDDWGEKWYTVYLSFNDGSKMCLQYVDYNKSVIKNGEPERIKTEDLHFGSLDIINDYATRRFVFDSSKPTPDDCYILEINDSHKQFAGSILNTLYEDCSVRFLLDNYSEIIEAYNAFPEMPGEFCDEKKNFKKYDIPEFQEEKGDVVIRIKGGREWHWPGYIHHSYTRDDEKL